MDKHADTTELEALQLALVQWQAKAMTSGQRVIVAAGLPLGTPGATNMVRIAYVGQDAISEE